MYPLPKEVFDFKKEKLVEVARRGAQILLLNRATIHGPGRNVAMLYMLSEIPKQKPELWCKLISAILLNIYNQPVNSRIEEVKFLQIEVRFVRTPHAQLR